MKFYWALILSLPCRRLSTPIPKSKTSKITQFFFPHPFVSQVSELGPQGNRDIHSASCAVWHGGAAGVAGKWPCLPEVQPVILDKTLNHIMYLSHNSGLSVTTVCAILEMTYFHPVDPAGQTGTSLGCNLPRYHLFLTVPKASVLHSLSHLCSRFTALMQTQWLHHKCCVKS